MSFFILRYNFLLTQKPVWISHGKKPSASHWSFYVWVMTASTLGCAFETVNYGLFLEVLPICKSHRCFSHWRFTLVTRRWCTNHRHLIIAPLYVLTYFALPWLRMICAVQRLGNGVGVVCGYFLTFPGTRTREDNYTFIVLVIEW